MNLPTKHRWPSEAPEEPEEESDAMIGDDLWNRLGEDRSGFSTENDGMMSESNAFFNGTCESGGAVVHRSVKRGLLRSGFSAD